MKKQTFPKNLKVGDIIKFVPCDLNKDNPHAYKVTSFHKDFINLEYLNNDEKKGRYPRSQYYFVNNRQKLKKFTKLEIVKKVLKNEITIS